jgi:hypothetical protein
MWHVLTTIARQSPRDMFSMWSDPSLLPNNGKAAFSTGSVLRQQWGQPCFLCGLFPGYILVSCSQEVPELPSAWGYSLATLSPGVINTERMNAGEDQQQIYCAELKQFR